MLWRVMFWIEYLGAHFAAILLLLDAVQAKLLRDRCLLTCGGCAADMQYYVAIRHVRVLGTVCPTEQLATCVAVPAIPRQLASFLPPASLPALLQAHARTVFGAQTATSMAVVQSVKRPRSPTMLGNARPEAVRRSREADGDPSCSRAIARMTLDSSSALRPAQSASSSHGGLPNTQRAGAPRHIGWRAESRLVRAASPGRGSADVQLWSKAVEMRNSIAEEDYMPPAESTQPQPHALGQSPQIAHTRQSSHSAAGLQGSPVARSRPMMDMTGFHTPAFSDKRQHQWELWSVREDCARWDREGPGGQLHRGMPAARFCDQWKLDVHNLAPLPISKLFGAVRSRPVDVPML
jgi:hypothetical protein